MPGGEPALRIVCNYEQSNCERRARAECHGPYDVITKGDRSCADCGIELGQQPGDEAYLNSSVFKGVIYVRCREARR